MSSLFTPIASILRFISATTLLISISALAVPAYAKELQRTALVIGNSQYESISLANPGNDADDMAAVLRDRGFNVILIKDADRKRMRKALRTFGEKLKDGGIGLFYYAGHGVQTGGVNYLIPLDADIQVEDEIQDEAISADLVLRKMNSAGNQLNIAIFDACRNNPYTRQFRSLSRGLARMVAPVGTIVAYSTSPGSVAADGEGRNGLYTQYLLEQIKKPGMSIEQVFKQTRRSVRDATSGRQTPWEESSLTGDFYFTASLSQESALAQLRKETAQLALQQKVDGERVAAYESQQKKYEEQIALLNKRVNNQPPPQGEVNPSVSSNGIYQDKTDTPVIVASLDASEKLWEEHAPELISLKGGCYDIGFEGKEFFWDDKKKIAHNVCVSDFNIGKFEVTQGLWKSIMGTNASKFNKDDNNPVEKVSWHDVHMFIDELNTKTGKHYRLPTEAEWEYACRSKGKKQRYCGGSKVAKLGWYSGNSDYASNPVGKKSPNKLGLYDMSGNVSEWTCSEFASQYEGKESTCAPVDSRGRRVVRGGFWSNKAKSLESSARSSKGPSHKSSILGFRLASD